MCYSLKLNVVDDHLVTIQFNCSSIMVFCTRLYLETLDVVELSIPFSNHWF